MWIACDGEGPTYIFRNEEEVDLFCETFTHFSKNEFEEFTYNDKVIENIKNGYIQHEITIHDGVIKAAYSHPHPTKTSYRLDKVTNTNSPMYGKFVLHAQYIGIPLELAKECALNLWNSDKIQEELL